MIMLSLNNIRKGMVVELDGEPYLVTSADFLKKQQRRPVVRTVLKHLVADGRTKEHTFMQSDRIKPAQVERRPYQFLYRSEGKCVFMNQETFEQVELAARAVGEADKFLLEGQEVTALLFNGAVVAAQLPVKIKRKVITSPPGVKGNTSTNVMKEVVVEGGVTIKAPLFIREGDKVYIDTRSGRYAERA